MRGQKLGRVGNIGKEYGEKGRRRGDDMIVKEEE
jgi:hypothetical protein